ncbi:MAG: hypothetical protein JW745_01325, partial [Sedimentisphaerales bacterium]|nr:hypothetical protein [Sedimentisphaerales bacterium]
QRVEYFDNGNLELCYYKNRWYYPAFGRMLSIDPLGIVPNAYMNRYSPLGQYRDGINVYGYVKNMPVILIDKYGLTFGSCFSECMLSLDPSNVSEGEPGAGGVIKNVLGNAAMCAIGCATSGDKNNDRKLCGMRILDVSLCSGIQDDFTCTSCGVFKVLKRIGSPYVIMSPLYPYFEFDSQTMSTTLEISTYDIMQTIGDYEITCSKNGNSYIKKEELKKTIPFKLGTFQVFQSKPWEVNQASY